MQFGPSLDKRKMLGLVAGTKWNEFIELNRLAFADWLPRNSESRALGYAMRWIRKTYPHLKWVISFADATQCGDGTIYRASGFVLTSIKRNSQLFRLKDGRCVHAMNFKTARPTPIQRQLRSQLQMPTSSVEVLLKAAGAKPLSGFQLRYVYFLDRSWMSRLSVSIIPFEQIKTIGASMYRGKRAGSAASGTPDNQSGRDGATPIPALPASTIFTTPIPANNSLASQLHVVARMIAGQAALGTSRQVFLVSLGGFDHHDDLLNLQATRLATVDGAISAFWSWLGEIDRRNDVTLFTASDFGRTLTSNGDGSDHGWGSHQIVLGGGVAGGNILGDFPPTAYGTAFDVGQGNLAPSIAVDQYAATLAQWLGVADGNMSTVLPNIGNFDTRYLNLFTA